MWSGGLGEGAFSCVRTRGRAGLRGQPDPSDTNCSVRTGRVVFASISTAGPGTVQPVCKRPSRPGSPAMRAASPPILLRNGGCRACGGLRRSAVPRCDARPGSASRSRSRRMTPRRGRRRLSSVSQHDPWRVCHRKVIRRVQLPPIQGSREASRCLVLCLCGDGARTLGQGCLILCGTHTPAASLAGHGRVAGSSGVSRPSPTRSPGTSTHPQATE